MCGTLHKSAQDKTDSLVRTNRQFAGRKLTVLSDVCYRQLPMKEKHKRRNVNFDTGKAQKSQA